MSTDTVSWSVTQALSEIKMLDKRIQRLTTETVFISTATKNNQRKDDMVHKAVSNYQQLRDLMEFRKRVKCAIVMSNATTSIDVGTQTYTVAEAIERKSSIQLDKQLLETMRRQRANVDREINVNNQEAKRNLQRLLEQNFGKDNTKTDPTSLSQTEDAFWTNNRWEKIDPLKLDTQIERLTDDIEMFDKNVDFALSASNSQTKVTIRNL